MKEWRSAEPDRTPCHVLAPQDTAVLSDASLEVESPEPDWEACPAICSLCGTQQRSVRHKKG